MSLAETEQVGGSGGGGEGEGEVAAVLADGEGGVEVRAVIGVGEREGDTGHFALCPMVLRRLENNQQRFGSEHNVNQEAVEDGGEDRLV